MPQKSNNQQHKQHNISRFKLLFDDLERRFTKIFQLHITKPILLVSISEQKLYLISNKEIISSYSISSAEKGIGNTSGSYQTPLGLHQISEKFGENAPFASIFKARKNTHRIAKVLNSPGPKSPDDNITSRILWLDGLEDGVNRGNGNEGNNVDSHARYIYIHGTDEEGRLGEPASHGCIRMANQAVIELFEQVGVGNLVFITKD